MTRGKLHKSMAGALVLTLALMVSACLLSPGKFTSQLDLRKDGRFSFSYSGEMYLLTLTDFAKNSKNKGNDGVFEPKPCNVTNGVERECTAAELDQQMREWEEEQKNKGQREEQEAKQMAAMLGGFDPSDPKAAEELVSALRRQAGWHSVEYKGNGRFDVDFSISGRLDHDFAFPTIERFPMANAFVQLSLHEDGKVRIDAPGYSAASMGGPFQAFGQMAMIEQAGKNKDAAPLPEIDGTFTVTTDAPILANNTQGGPATDPVGQKLSWTVNKRTATEPTALVQLDR